ncbi:MAG: ATP-binding protein [Ruminococcaceae bacterium]|nr:ATP-binding protein [Oscillospiraceae bacterium]
MNIADNKFTLSERVDSLIIFRNLLSDETISMLCRLDAAHKSGGSRAELIGAYCDFTRSLFCRHHSLGAHLLGLILEDENIYTEYKLTGKGNGEALESLLCRELDILSDIAGLDGSVYRDAIGDGSLPLWGNSAVDIAKDYREHIKHIRSRGTGVFAKYRMFILNGEGKLTPISNPDGQALSDLVGYERERERVILNTEAFLDGKPANNVLLYGDAGTGKSSTVKAIANAYADRGLRLVELKKNQLPFIQPLMDTLADNPLKFILFIDDLTFSSGDADFCALKATLEGGVAGRGSNILIYATSNHRHMIKEMASDRVGDEISVSDKLQEIVSLSARFGLTVTYSRADKALYSDIVIKLARRRGIEMDEQQLISKAEAFALRGGGRNPRSAVQFIDMIAAGIY